MLTLQVLTYIEGNDQTNKPILKYTTREMTPWKEDYVFKLNCREKRTQASPPTTRT